MKELALYIEDQIKAGNWNFNLGIRGDKYNGLADASQAEPRAGHRVQHQAADNRPGRLLCAHIGNALQRKPGALQQRLLGCGAGTAACAAIPAFRERCSPGFRNEFHAGLQQAFGKYLVVSGEYIWKYTHNAFDFSVLGNTPITFPIDWHNSKIPGYALHAEVPELHHFSAYFDASSVAARFFGPQIAGAGATSGVAVGTNTRSASTTTRSSTRPPTSSTRCPRWQLSTASGAASTGGSTPASSPARRPAMVSPIPTRLRQQSVTDGTPAIDGQPAAAGGQQYTSLHQPSKWEQRILR